MLDTPWKIAALVGGLIFLRLLVGALKKLPQRIFLVELLNSALIAFALVFLLIRPFLLQAFYIPSGSMEETLHGPDPFTRRPGDRILVNKFIYHLGQPRRGDILVFGAPPQAFYGDRFDDGAFNGSKDFIKRVIGLPGDRVQVKAGDGVYVNGQRLNEPYLREPPNYDWPPPTSPLAEGSPAYIWPDENLGQPYVVPSGHIVVFGDNRNSSNDSHLWRDPQTGEARPALPLDRVLGRSLVIFWPPNRFGRLTH